ncbi:hypothetical protein BN971_04889 [Mycobacterium bohemicum DSM 44277]|uniref:Uncharacterized protein n=1 Tax=Mycobacterium bohemicum DSM 44277 TaxID=1236609 RepID=A0A0U0WFM8_MYCBE|nr:hypothetical protein BN971_04889 [Mycobacterium bohemicum DSM 44277]
MAVLDVRQRVGHPADRCHRDHGAHPDHQLRQSKPVPRSCFGRLGQVQPHRPAGRTVLVEDLGAVAHPHRAAVFGLRPGQFAVGHRLVIDHQHVAGAEVDDVTGGRGRREQTDRGARAQVQFLAAGGQQQSTRGRGRRGMRRCHHRPAPVHRKTLGEKRDAGPATDCDHGRQVRPALAVPDQHLVEREDEAGQPVLDQVPQLVAAQPHGAAAPAELGGEFDCGFGG